MVRLFALGLVAGVAADTLPTLASCGSDTDHLKITSITTDADATGGPRKGVPFTITVEGEMDEPHQHGTVAGDLNIKALGIVTEEVKFNQKYDFLPGLAKGATKIQIGPFTFPRSVPGEVDVIGNITLVNQNAEPVTCLDLNLKIPMIVSSWSDMLPSFLGVGKTNCGDPAQDHITNVVSHIDNATNIITTTMDLDEDLDYINLNVDLSFKAPVVPAVALTLPNLPISLSPAIPAGQLKFVGYPPESDSDGFKDAIDVTGSLKLEDKNGDEVACTQFGSSDALEASSGTLALTFTDCGDASTHGTVKDIEPKSLTLGVATDITGTGTLDEAAAGGAFVMKVSASGLIKQTLNGDICSSSSFDIKALGITVGTITWKGLSCPLAAGDVTVPLSAKLAASLPAALVHTTIALTATATSGDKLLCANIDLDKTGSVVV